MANLFIEFPRLSSGRTTDADGGPWAAMPQPWPRPAVSPQWEILGQSRVALLTSSPIAKLESSAPTRSARLRPSNFKCVSAVIRYKIVVNIFHYCRVGLSLSRRGKRRAKRGDQRRAERRVGLCSSPLSRALTSL